MESEELPVSRRLIDRERNHLQNLLLSKLYIREILFQFRKNFLQNVITTITTKYILLKRNTVIKMRNVVEKINFLFYLFVRKT